MKLRPRMYSSILKAHLAKHRQMVFVSGPRQAGKTTLCRAESDSYLDWDNTDARRIIQDGPTAVARHLGLEKLKTRSVTVTFDELHKNPRWKSFLKGFFDTYEREIRILVTGSSRLDVFRRGGDSLMARYFHYRLHPFSVSEILHDKPPIRLLHPPAPLPDHEFKALWRFGGYPEPFTVRNAAFHRKWTSLRMEQFVKEDLRDLSRVQDLSEIEHLTRLLADRSAGTLVYHNLAQTVGISVDTIRRWMDTLVSLHHGFLVRPWAGSLARSLRKEPRWYLRDWSAIEDPGSRFETFMACHLLKAVEGWTDLGLGTFELRYLRDKEKREVDFLLIQNGKPWILIEATMSDTNLNPALHYFQSRLGAPHALQAVFNTEPVIADCFAHSKPIVVPARTLLSQLL
jgi:uncharacterized protein